ncbi:MAG TPA: hypothetical protein ENN69_07010 [Spirochaetia bacterium]|nr:hypothetical protein [Spirochaetia bacterium]
MDLSQNNNRIRSWLLEGDAAIQFQTRRDLFQTAPEVLDRLQSRIAREGWGKRLLTAQRPDGHWGRGFYQPKWTSTHYTLLDLRNLGIERRHPAVSRAIDLILDHELGKDGGVNPSPAITHSDICINGMFLNYAAYFRTQEKKLSSIVDLIISQQMADGGFNCRRNRSGARHGSLHSSICVVEGIREYLSGGYRYKRSALQRAEKAAREFILLHRLFLSDRTGEVIDQRFLTFRYPFRWHYDILRALDYFRESGVALDDRMNPALEALLNKRKRDGRWTSPAPYPGETHLTMEKTGAPGRWNTLRALRVLSHFGVPFDAP